MKVMLVWKTVPGKYRMAIDQFLKAGAPLTPDGATTVGRWHTPGWKRSGGISSRQTTWRLSANTWLIGLSVLEIEVYPVCFEDTTAGVAVMNASDT